MCYRIYSVENNAQATVMYLFTQRLDLYLMQVFIVMSCHDVLFGCPRVCDIKAAFFVLFFVLFLQRGQFD